MFEYGISNIYTYERTVIFGYDLEDAFQRANLNPSDWEVEYSEFID